MAASLPLVVGEIGDLGPRLVRIRLLPASGKALPPFAAGAHIDVMVPNGLLRSYSLCSDPWDGSHYDITVALAADSRGGSDFLCRDLAEGDTLLVSPPREAFRLDAERSRHVFVSGGIGITPFIAMAHALNRDGSGFALHHAVRKTEDAPPDLLEPFGKRVKLHVGARGERLKMAELLAGGPADATYYFCGPASMLAEARRLTQQWPQGRARFESFANAAPVGKVAAGKPFVAKIRSSGQALAVSETETLLERLRRAGFDIGSSCEHGSCGTCRLRYLAGCAVHRDAVLGTEERAEWLTACVSRAEGELLLDL